MITTLILVLAAIVVVPLVLGLIFKWLWKVPAADEALIVTGFAVKGRSRRDAPSRSSPAAARSCPVLQKAQYLSLQADKALLEVEGVDTQKIPVGVRGVAIFKVGDDEQSITNAASAS